MVSFLHFAVSLNLFGPSFPKPLGHCEQQNKDGYKLLLYNQQFKTIVYGTFPFDYASKLFGLMNIT